jgi:flagellar hook assembly protein FlgD
MAQPGPVRLTVHDIQGRTVRELTDRVWTAGEHKIVWDGIDKRGALVVPGLYLAHLEMNGARLTQKLFRISRR